MFLLCTTELFAGQCSTCPAAPWTSGAFPSAPTFDPSGGTSTSVKFASGSVMPTENGCSYISNIHTPPACPAGSTEISGGDSLDGHYHYRSCTCPNSTSASTPSSSSLSCGKKPKKKSSALAHTRGKLTSSIGLTPASPLYSTASAMEGVCESLYRKSSRGSLSAGEKSLLQNCANLIGEGSSIAKIKGIQQISPVVLKSQQLTIRQTGSFTLGSIAGRLLALRESSGEAEKDTAMHRRVLPQNPFLKNGTNDWTPAYGTETGGAAGDFAEEERIGIFVNATGSTGERDPGEVTEGYDYDGFNLTVGGDYLLDSGVTVGAAVGFGTTDSELNNNGGSLDSDIVMLSLYGQRDFAGFYLDGIVGFGLGSYDNSRVQDFAVNGTALHQTLEGDTDGPILFTSLGGGKVMAAGGLDIDFSGRLSYLRAEVGGYQESSDNPAGEGLALEIDEQEITSIASELALRIAYPISMAFGVMQPEASMSYIHEFDDGGDDIRARFLHDPFSEGFVQSSDFGSTIPTIFSVPGEKLDTDYANLGLGLNFVLPYGQSIMLNATTMLLYDDYSHCYYTIGYRKDF